MLIVRMKANWMGFAACALALTATLAAQTPPKPKGGATVHSHTCGPLMDGTLHCPRFGFSYKTIFGWVDRTDDMQSDTAGTNPENGDAAKSLAGGIGKPETLLAVFERPPGAPGDTINSAVVIVAESLADYHGIKTAADYFGPITELAEQRGFKVETEPESFQVGTRQLVRGGLIRAEERRVGKECRIGSSSRWSSYH
jgi:hypothetical protein